MGYIAHGVWVPEFILEQPEVLRNVHHEFIHAGSDVTEAFQVTSYVANNYNQLQLSPSLHAHVYMSCMRRSQVKGFLKRSQLEFNTQYKTRSCFVFCLLYRNSIPFVDRYVMYVY